LGHKKLKKEKAVKRILTVIPEIRKRNWDQTKDVDKKSQVG